LTDDNFEDDFCDDGDKRDVEGQGPLEDREKLARKEPWTAPRVPREHVGWAGKQKTGTPPFGWRLIWEAEGWVLPDVPVKPPPAPLADEHCNCEWHALRRATPSINEDELTEPVDEETGPPWSRRAAREITRNARREAKAWVTFSYADVAAFQGHDKHWGWGHVIRGEDTRRRSRKRLKLKDGSIVRVEVDGDGNGKPGRPLGKPGRPPSFEKAMTDAERQRLKYWRDKGHDPQNPVGQRRKPEQGPAYSARNKIFGTTEKGKRNAKPRSTINPASRSRAGDGRANHDRKK
jgi:hypothetical protein